MPDTLDSPEDPEIGEREVLECVIVGAGPAGLTAGLYLRRFHRKVRIVDAGASRAPRIPRSNNVAGFPEGVAGVQLLERMNRYLRQGNGCVIRDTVPLIERRPEGSRVHPALQPEHLVHRDRWRAERAPFRRGNHGSPPPSPRIGAPRGRESGPKDLRDDGRRQWTSLRSSVRRARCRPAHPTGRPAGRPPRRAAIWVTDSHCRTSVANLYAAGDVVSALDQISVAVGYAAVAATTVHNTLLTDSA